MPLIRSFMMASSALIVSMYFELSVFGAGAVRATGRATGRAAAGGAAGDIPLSKQASLAAESAIALQLGVWAKAVWHSAHVRTSVEKSLISIPVGDGTRRCLTVLPDLSLLFNSIKEFVLFL